MKAQTRPPSIPRDDRPDDGGGEDEVRLRVADADQGAMVRFSSAAATAPTAASVKLMTLDPRQGARVARARERWRRPIRRRAGSIPATSPRAIERFALAHGLRNAPASPDLSTRLFHVKQRPG